MTADAKRVSEDALAIVMGERPNPEAFLPHILDAFASYVNPGILKARKSVTEAGDEAAVEWEGYGSLLFDVSGRRFIDCLGGYGIYSFGMRHPDIVAAVQAQLNRSPLHSQELLDPLRALLAELLAATAPGDLTRSFFCNSGTEAVEAAIKLAMWNTGRHTFVAMENGFHGKTIGSVSLMGPQRYREPFQPALIECTLVPYGDVAALEHTVQTSSPKPAAVVLEAVQGEGGAIPAPDGYLADVRRVCTNHGVLMIVDEVQTCLGRTGTFFAVEHDQVVPDIICLGKSLGGGIMAMGAIMSSPKWWKVWEPNPFIHSNTFGGNPLACAASIAAIHVALRDDLAGEAGRKGQRFLDEVGAMARRYPNVLESITGRGLLLAMHFKSNEIGYAVSADLFRRGVLVAGTTANARAVRIEPALTIEDDLITEVLQILDAALSEVARTNI